MLKIFYYAAFIAAWFITGPARLILWLDRKLRREEFRCKRHWKKTPFGEDYVYKITYIDRDGREYD